MNLINNKICNQNLICYHLSNKIFQKKLYFPREKRKTIFGDQVPFERKRASDDENEYNLSKREMRF